MVGRGEKARATVETADGRRQLACFPAAVLGLIIDQTDRFLLLSRPDRDAWQVLAGALEPAESPRDAVMRETAEEIGPAVRIEPIGVAHAYQFPYDPSVPPMLSIAYVARYVSGDIQPGSDMAGSTAGWFTLDEISNGHLLLFMPELPWLCRRALTLAHACSIPSGEELEPWADR